MPKELSVTPDDLRDERARGRRCAMDLVIAMGAHISEDGSLPGTFGNWDNDNVTSSHKALTDQLKIVDIKSKQQASNAFSGTQLTLDNVEGFSDDGPKDSQESAPETIAEEPQWLACDLEAVDAHLEDFEGDAMAQLELRQDIAKYLIGNPDVPCSASFVALKAARSHVSMEEVGRALEFLASNSEGQQDEILEAVRNGEQPDVSTWQVLICGAEDGTRMYVAKVAHEPKDEEDTKRRCVEATIVEPSAEVAEEPVSVEPASTLRDVDTDAEVLTEQEALLARILEVLGQKAGQGSPRQTFHELLKACMVDASDLEDALMVLDTMGSIGKSDELLTEVWLAQPAADEQAA